LGKGESKAVDELKSRYRKAVFIWIDMVFSIFIYALGVEIMKRNSAFLQTTSPLQEGGMPAFILLIFAILTFFLIKYIHNQILYIMPSGNPAGPKSPLAPRLLNASLVSDAICESVAIYGLILFGLTKNSFDFYIFMVLSLIYFAFSFPRYTQWEEWIQETERKESSAIFAPS
jgi:hypothetical protein